MNANVVSLKELIKSDIATGSREWLIEECPTAVKETHSAIVSARTKFAIEDPEGNVSYLESFYLRLKSVQYSALGIEQLRAFLEISYDVYRTFTRDTVINGSTTADTAESISGITNSVERSLSPIASLLLSNKALRDTAQFDELIEQFKRQTDMAQREIRDNLATIQSLRAELDNKFDEAQGVIQQMREAAASIGITEYNRAFNDEVQVYEKSADRWLLDTVGSLVLLIVAVVSLFLFNIAPIATQADGTPATGIATVAPVVGDTVLRLTVVSALTFFVLFCSRNYAAARHNAVVNKHKVAALKTFRAFIAGTDDQAVKDEILKQAAQAVFVSQSSGFLRGEGDSPSNNQIIQLMRDSANPK